VCWWVVVHSGPHHDRRDIDDHKHNSNVHNKNTFLLDVIKLSVKSGKDGTENPLIEDEISKNRKSHEVTMSSSPSLGASFHPLSPFRMRSAKQGNFIKSQYEMLKLIICLK
jgi:hypothetical protein